MSRHITKSSQVTFDELMGQLAVPEGIQKHLLWVAGTGEALVNHWSGPTIDRVGLRRVLLLHDVGNVVKIDPRSETEVRIKQEFVDRFGQDDHVVSETIAAAVGLTEDELRLMRAKVFVNNDRTVVADSWEQKIGAYADQRVAPTGVDSLMGRLDEATERYRDKPGSSMNNPRTGFLVACAVEIERQLFEHVSLAPDAITTELAESYGPTLRREIFERAPWQISDASS